MSEACEVLGAKSPSYVAKQPDFAGLDGGKDDSPRGRHFETRLLKVDGFFVYKPARVESNFLFTFFHCKKSNKKASR